MRLRDEIALKQAAAKRREHMLLWALAVCVAGLAVYVVWHRLEATKMRGDSAAEKEVHFADRTLQLPASWRHLPEQSSATKLTMTRPDLGPQTPVLTIEDLRQNPVVAREFVGKWKEAPHTADYNPVDVDTYYDASANAVGAACVRMDFTDPLRPIRVICVSNDGQWKLTLNGRNRDLRSMDTLVDQFLVLER